MKKITLTIACKDADVEFVENQLDTFSNHIQGSLCRFGIETDICNESEVDYVAEKYEVDLDGVDDRDIDKTLDEALQWNLEDHDLHGELDDKN